MATVSMSKWDVQMWCMSLNYFWSSLIVLTSQEKFGNNTRPDSQRPLPTHLENTHKSEWTQVAHSSQQKVICAIYPIAYLWSAWVMVDGSLFWQQSCLSHFLWSVFVIFLFYFFYWILHFLLLHQIHFNVFLFTQKIHTRQQLTLRT